MKKYKILLAILMMAMMACQKGELYYTNDPSIVEVTFTGSSSVPLEFVYNNDVVDSTIGQFNSIPGKFQLNISKGDQKIYVREKGKSDILKSYTIDAASYRQEFGIFYEDGKIYDAGINYNLMIFAKDGPLDFYLDDRLIYQDLYGGVILSTLKIPINKEQQRILTVKKKGETAVLVTRDITQADSNKVLKFFLTRNTVVESIKIPALKNPQGMSMTFALQQNVEFGQTTFLGGDLDLVFYMRDLNTGEVSRIEPELRVTVPATQLFVTVELPPPPADHVYTFDILKKGTNEAAYLSNTPAYTVKPAEGKSGYIFFLVGGDTKMFLPGERHVGEIAIAEEFGGENFDEIYVTPAMSTDLSLFLNIENE
ncbi:hypothetical protein HHL16_20055 [Pseudoflavitalea sp. G-6-1-2]|uniref:hypothetical protein n=1 Tax=Pseudoflavitalea sp. G-6-1-2 TaxID=2728841 RepID=UPI00146F13D2|nr:hypothetical protein [Pseudoflavitalea sp. G-6-1-2]NML23182.1 hypothetical protein [Pseudoflavitalea sp. G-6-1-2]